jgi:DedD protein
MGLLSIFQRNKQAAAKPVQSGRGGKPAARQAPLVNSRNPADTAEAVREARARARTRLMGATVLLLIGVIGFPLLFETQPRPIPVDLPIEIPARNAPGVVDATSTTRPHGNASTATTLSSPVGSASTLVASGPTPASVSYDVRPSAAAPASDPASPPPAHRSAFASLAAALTPSAARTSDVPASAATVSALPGSTVAQARPAPRPVKAPAASATTLAAVAAPTSAPHLAAPAPVVPASPSPPAAILAGAPSTKPSDAVAAGGRFVVQVGAFTDDTKIREVRAKVEKIGLKTYTQQVDTPGGKRVRVRVGPYATKAEADRVASKIKADGLPAAAVLAL